AATQAFKGWVGGDVVPVGAFVALCAINSPAGRVLRAAEQGPGSGSLIAGVAARAAVDVVVPAFAEQEVGVGVAEQVVGAASTVDPVAACAALELVAIVIPRDPVVTAAA